MKTWIAVFSFFSLLVVISGQSDKGIVLVRSSDLPVANDAIDSMGKYKEVIPSDPPLPQSWYLTEVPDSYPEYKSHPSSQNFTIKLGWQSTPNRSRLYSPQNNERNYNLGILDSGILITIKIKKFRLWKEGNKFMKLGMKIDNQLMNQELKCFYWHVCYINYRTFIKGNYSFLISFQPYQQSQRYLYTIEIVTPGRTIYRGFDQASSNISRIIYVSEKTLQTTIVLHNILKTTVQSMYGLRMTLKRVKKFIFMNKYEVYQHDFFPQRYLINNLNRQIIWKKKLSPGYYLLSISSVQRQPFFFQYTSAPFPCNIADNNFEKKNTTYQACFFSPPEKSCLQEQKQNSGCRVCNINYQKYLGRCYKLPKSCPKFSSFQPLADSNHNTCYQKSYSCKTSQGTECLTCKFNKSTITSGICQPQCRPEQKVIGWNCFNDDSNCEEWYPSGNCKRCKKMSFFFLDATCHKIIANCTAYNPQIKKCSQCMIGYFLNQEGECDPRPADCAKIDFDKKTCLECRAGYWLNSSEICEEVVCPKGEVPVRNQNQCRKVDPGCLRYHKRTGACISCKVIEYERKNYSCIKVPISENCSSNSNSKYCRAPERNCQIETKNKNSIFKYQNVSYPILRCQKCMQGWFSSNNGECTLSKGNCEEGNIEIKGKCFSMVKNCQRVQFQGKCIKCNINHAFIRGQCIERVPESAPQFVHKVQICKKFSKKTGRCESCPDWYLDDCI